MARNRRRVLVATPDFPPDNGGIQLLLHAVVSNLSGVESRVVTLDAPDAAAFDQRGRIDVRRAPGSGNRKASVGLLNALTVQQAVAFRPDVILSGHIVAAPGAAISRRVLGIPFCQYLHADEVQARPALARFALRDAYATIAVSRYTAGLAVDAGADPTSVRVIPVAVDQPQTRRPPAKARRPTVVTVARLRERYKGHDVFLRALPLIRSQVPDVEWVVIGDGPLRPQLEALAQALDVAGCVRFAGSLDDEQRNLWLERAHVFVMTSRLRGRGGGGEGFGIVYLEAAARRLPVVAGDVGGALDAVEPGETGLLVDPTDHVAVAQAVTDLLLDGPRAERMGLAGADRTERFNWPAVAAQVEELLLEAGVRGGRRRGDR